MLDSKELASLHRHRFSGDDVVRHCCYRLAVLATLLATYCAAYGAQVNEPSFITTSGMIAIRNLDQQIARLGDDPGVEELLLVRQRFLSDYEALDRACALTEGRLQTSADLLRRARTRAAVHRFADALDDIKVAESKGATSDETRGLRASILVATGHAREVIPELQADVAHRPGFASRTALAAAYSEVGRVAEADRLYVAALGDLDTTLPFPYAWIYFARGLMWADQGGDAVRGEANYKRALTYLPEFVAANAHLAQLEAAHGDTASAIDRLEHVVVTVNDPEALALLGGLYVKGGDAVRGREEISLAQQRYESLLARYPLGFADHGAGFYLGPGADPERAWDLAQRNLANRKTDRAYALAIMAAEATGRYREACDLILKTQSQPEKCKTRQMSLVKTNVR
jgi:tetratricopeptide (TPR) repeat protein